MSMVSTKEIAQLSIGREMDILVAEQVLGWRIEKDEAELKRLDKYFSRHGAQRWWRKPGGGWHYDPSPFSSEISAAWQVVERMNSRGLALFLVQTLEESMVAFDKPSTTEHHYVTDKSVTKAICKAALLAATSEV
jgi:hypothetical protein